MNQSTASGMLIQRMRKTLGASVAPRPGGVHYHVRRETLVGEKQRPDLIVERERALELLPLIETWILVLHRSWLRNIKEVQYVGNKAEPEGQRGNIAKHMIDTSSRSHNIWNFLRRTSCLREERQYTLLPRTPTSRCWLLQRG